jgi:hypothetical protein
VINISGDVTRCWWTECDGLVGHGASFQSVENNAHQTPGPNIYGSGLGIVTAFPVYAPPPPCSVTFEIRAARVAGFTRRGPGCVAPPPD